MMRNRKRFMGKALVNGYVFVCAMSMNMQPHCFMCAKNRSRLRNTRISLSEKNERFFADVFTEHGIFTKTEALFVFCKVNDHCAKKTDGASFLRNAILLLFHSKRIRRFACEALAFAEDAAWPIGLMNAIGEMLSFKTKAASMTIDPAVFAGAGLHAVCGVELHTGLIGCGA